MSQLVKTAVLTHSHVCYAARQLRDVGKLRGHERLLTDDQDCIGRLFEYEPECTSTFNAREEFEAVFAWLDTRGLGRGLAVMRECEATGAYSPNASMAIVSDVIPFPQLQWWDQHTAVSVVNTLFELVELRAAGS